MTLTVTIAEIVRGQIHNQGMVACKSEIKDENRLREVPHTPQFRGIRRGKLVSRIGKVFGGVLIHPIANFPRVSALQQFF